MITPMFQSSVIMFPASGASVSKYLLVTELYGKAECVWIRGRGAGGAALTGLNSEPIRARIMEKYKLMEHYEIDPDGKYPYTEFKNVQVEYQFQAYRIHVSGDIGDGQGSRIYAAICQ